MVKKITAGMLLLTMLCGFSSVSDRLKDQLRSMPQQYEQFDLKLGWNVSSEKDTMLVAGVIQNVRYAFMEDVEIWVSALDADGKVVARAADFVLPRRLTRDEPAAFAVKLPKAAGSVTTLQFTYKYEGSDGGGNDGDAIKWMQSFEAKLPAGMYIPL
jgi:hypothetical protein